MPPRIDTLVIPLQPGRILLGMKKRGFGEGNWNGFGGKVEGDETIETAARREVAEEVGLTVGTLVPAGTLSFSFDDRPGWLLEVHVFTTTDWTGEPKETEEMRPQWFATDKIPYEHMWLDDPYWLPHVLAGKQVTARFHFHDQQHLATHHVTVQ